MSPYDRNKFPKILVIILLAGFFLRLFLSQFLTYYPDLYTYQLWSLDVIRYGFRSFYNVSVSDYLPGYIYVLWFFGKIYYFINAKLFYIPAEFVYKLPSIFTDLGNAVLIYSLLKGRVSDKVALFATLSYYLNPVFIFNSTIWGQSESIVTFSLLGGLYFLVRKNFTLSSMFLAFGQATKPIVILILPLILSYVYFREKRIKLIYRYLFFFIVTYLILFIPFCDSINLPGFVLERNLFTSGFWNYTSLNAFNFWGLITVLFEGKLSQVNDLNSFLVMDYHTWGIILFLWYYFSVLFYSLTGMKLDKKKQCQSDALWVGTYIPGYVSITYKNA